MPRDFGSVAADPFGPVRPEPGDAVVHPDYGIGRFEGMERIEADGTTHEMARLTYADGDSVMVPGEEFGTVWRYGRDIGVRYDVLKGSDWPERRVAIHREVEAVAEALIEKAAARRARRAEPMTPDRDAFARLCDGFAHMPTPGQATAFSAVAEDLGSGRAMDRILLGDVGTGKTEVILRAAAFAALSGRQVAIAVPTTVLCRQHARTLAARLDAVGLTVRDYSSNASDAERRAIRKGLADGSVDVVVGTHGLTAKAVRFADLGLVVIDEEHKFGARRKAALNRMGEGVNRLVTTATPIPRMLTAAETGLLDLSILPAPPARRKPVETRVGPLDEGAMARLLAEEIDAGGRAYVICPRIADMDAARAMLSPDLRVAVAHGKMKADAVDAAMTAFASGEADVLLATALVENGLDITQANAMVVLDAERFGLTQLHQLRGRIGRGERQARMLVCHGADPGEEAQARLALLAETDRLGSGFDIAMADRNRRGAGDILGEDQSGHLSAVGPGFYRHLLREALSTRRGRAGRRERPERRAAA